MSELTDDIEATTRAIHSWNLPAALIEAVTDEQLATWGRLQGTVAQNCDEGLRIATQLVSQHRDEDAQAILDRVRQRWVAWLRQVQGAVRDPHPFWDDRSAVERANDAMHDYYDTFEGVVASASDALAGGARLLPLVAIAVVLIVMARR